MVGVSFNLLVARLWCKVELAYPTGITGVGVLFFAFFIQSSKLLLYSETIATHNNAWRDRAEGVDR